MQKMCIVISDTRSASCSISFQTTTRKKTLSPFYNNDNHLQKVTTTILCFILTSTYRIPRYLEVLIDPNEFEVMMFDCIYIFGRNFII